MLSPPYAEPRKSIVIGFLTSIPQTTLIYKDTNDGLIMVKTLFINNIIKGKFIISWGKV